MPLSTAKGEKPFLLELRYTLPSDGRRFDLPEFVAAGESKDQTADKETPAAVKAYLCVYLPKTRVLLGARGPWTQEFGWQWDDSLLRRRPSIFDPSDYAPVPVPCELVDWVREGVEMPGNPTDDFQTDGVAYVYSTLRPAAPRVARWNFARSMTTGSKGRFLPSSPSWASCSCRPGCR